MAAAPILAPVLALLAASPLPSSAEEDAALVERLSAEFLEAGPAARDALFEELVVAARRAHVAELLRQRQERALAVVRRGGTLAQLERLAEHRRELDRAREAALDLIYDERQYFYPYNVPHVEPGVASKYPAVQQEVAELVDEVRRVWTKRRKVKVPADFRAAAEELGWNAARQDSIRTYHDLPDDVPAWVAALPDEPAATLATFAWTAAERDALARDRAVRARNERVWKGAKKDRDLPDAARPGKAEQDQVRITNDYRVMMGRPALGWNATMMEAAQGHSDWMSRWGVLSHYEEGSDETYDVTARNERLGYEWVSGENCSMGRADPKSAFEGWFGSSGHHRNMLAAHHRELAAAESGGYWTQNYGTREPTAEELSR